MGKVFVVRHGETDYNRERRYTGRIDIPLNATGTAQAARAASELRDCGIDVVLVSPLYRARQTAAIIARTLRLPVQIVGEFTERCEGVLEGLTVDEVERQYPDERNPDVVGDWRHAPPGGESLQEVESRVLNGLLRALVQWPNHNILIVTHYVVARIIFKHFRRPTMEEFFAYRPENCSIADYECIAPLTASKR